jgi:hypothetical protein
MGPPPVRLAHACLPRANCHRGTSPGRGQSHIVSIEITVTGHRPDPGRAGAAFLGMVAHRPSAERPGPGRLALPAEAVLAEAVLAEAVRAVEGLLAVEAGAQSG